MYCRFCGKNIAEDSKYCPYCGAPVYQEDFYPRPRQENGSGFGWGVPGFFIPIVGLILFLVWKNEMPVRAKSAGIGALIGVIVEIVFVFFFYSYLLPLVEMYYGSI